MKKKIVSNIEKFNVQRAYNTNELVMKVMEKYEIVESITKLDDLIPEKSYGAIWKAVKRLSDIDKIMVKGIIDKNEGVRKKMIFLSQDVLDDYLKDQRSRFIDCESSHEVHKIPEYHQKLDELFKLLMKKSNDPMADEVQLYIINKLGDIGVSPMKMDKLEAQGGFK